MHGSHMHQSVRNAKSYAWVRAEDAGKDGRGMMETDRIFFTRHRRCVDDIYTYGSFENIHAGLQLFMVAIRTNLHRQVYSAWVRADAGKDGRGMMETD